MHRRYEGENIPIEILRTLVTISEAGTFAKAASKLKLSQPAITAQMKRLQSVVGGPIFDRESGVLLLTDLGTLILDHARKIVAENDQILLLGSGSKEAPGIRLGLSTFYVEDFLLRWAGQQKRAHPHIVSDYSEGLLKRLSEGYLNIVCCIEGISKIPFEPVETWDEPFAWVRSPRFFLTHGQPIPIVARAGWLAEHPMIRALETAGMPYEIVFASPDHHARIAAVSAGIGLCAIPKRLMPPSLVVASDRTLPPLPKVRGAIYRHPSVRRHESDWLISLLKTLHPGTSHHRQRDTDSEATSKMMKSSISQGGQIR